MTHEEIVEELLLIIGGLMTFQCTDSVSQTEALKALQKIRREKERRDKAGRDIALMAARRGAN